MLKGKLGELVPAFDHCTILVYGDLRGLTEVGRFYVFHLDVDAFVMGLATVRRAIFCNILLPALRSRAP